MMQPTLFLLVVLGVSSVWSAVPASLPDLADELVAQFELHSRAVLAEKGIAPLAAHMRESSSDADEASAALTDATTRIQRLFQNRIAALKELTGKAEAAANEYTERVIRPTESRADKRRRRRSRRSADDDGIPTHAMQDASTNDDVDDMYISDDPEEAFCDAHRRRLNGEDVRTPFDGDDWKKRPGIHVNVESYECDPGVVRDFEWTNTHSLNETMIQLGRADEEMNMYIGTYSGLTRMYPPRKWRIEPAQITIDLFDPRFRPWFIQGESPPKDVVFLIDYSGSVKGPTLHLIKITMMYILSTLGPNDYFYGVWFNSAFDPILNCSGKTFLPATTRNKKVFFERLAELEEKDQAHVAPALRMSYDVLRGQLKGNSSLSIFPQHARSGGHKMVLLLTDGLDEWPTGVFSEEIENAGEDIIRLFGFAMGYGTGDLPTLQWMGCKSGASQAIVDSISDVKTQSRSYLDVLSRVNGLVNGDKKVEERAVGWTSLYMDTQGAGPVVSMSMPIPLKSDPFRNESTGWLRQQIAGVAAVDVKLSELTPFLPRGSTYAFIIDSNGIVIYHPLLRLPKTEVHNVRRSACYDASQVRMKAGGGLRVQYGFSDERVYRLVGLIDSIPTLDVSWMEGNDSRFMQLRSAMIDGKCDGTAHVVDEKEYRCRSIEGTPYSIAVVRELSQSTVQYTGVPPADPASVVKQPMLAYMTHNRAACNFAFDHLPSAHRLTALLQDRNCPEDLSFTQALTAGVHDWALSWPEPDLNSTWPMPWRCEGESFPRGFARHHFVAAFVHTREQMTVYYPKCAHRHIKEAVRKFDTERFKKDAGVNELQFSIRSEGIIAYRSVVDKHMNRLAVVAAQWKAGYLDRVFSEFTSKRAEWKACRTDKLCYLVTRSGHVVASSSSNRHLAHLSRFDPQVFDYLSKKKLITTMTHLDGQAECVAKRTAPWSSPASRHRPIRSVIHSLVSVLSGSLWWEAAWGAIGLLWHTASAQPQMEQGKCVFQRVNPFERCVLEHTYTEMRLNQSKQIQAGSSCQRYFSIHTLPNTTLTLIIATTPCATYTPRHRMPPSPRRLSGCDIIRSEYRKRPDWEESRRHPLESHGDCDAAFNSKGRVAMLAPILIMARILNLL